VTNPTLLVAGRYNPEDKSDKKVYEGAATVPFPAGGGFAIYNPVYGNTRRLPGRRPFDENKEVPRGVQLVPFADVASVLVPAAPVAIHNLPFQTTP
jgi:hypothetical protein